ncbi:hypothetical protein ACIQU3_29255 [Streptomyces sp. NPDC101110]|uniref:hypothetical protein n=1 Tax=Streptomyces sp. NPDC101110 TaxID=3366104 RepID=UPI0037FB8643
MTHYPDSALLPADTASPDRERGGAHRLRIPSGDSPRLSHTEEVADVLAEAVTRAAIDD